ncbi:F5/8 type C domain-containing protein [Actinacidiphila yanglinensis]|uniref:F5/8 type C domain-containing protein n=1 Tax=Actinacidiphila yanglinensis TaxID=310779 RepID=A0A1H6E395_9ACTN|nr:discoidin domain-containing protein [Actinacidiphila yanglinensis]SEG92168.1 F5/8 type C domain-containing protein [Actinacidiphila yanglinensis]
MKKTRPRRRGLAVSAGAAVALLAGFLSTGWTAAAAPSHSALPAITLSVSPDGHGRTCSSHDPCALTTAQSEVRSASRTAQADIDVVLAGGTYRLGSTLALDAAKGDGGTSGHHVTYEAAPGAHPVLSGGERVQGWTQDADGVWEAKVPAGTDTRQMYVDGVRGIRARGAHPTGFTRTATGYTTSDTTLDSWKNISDVQFVYDVGWTEIYCGVASVSGTAVTMDQPCFDNSTKKPYGVNADTPTYVENARELLNDPGEWYLDKTAHTVYYKPREGQDLRTADVEIPRLQTLVSGTGTEASPLKDVAFQGISFEYGGWTQPNGPDGFSEVQANMHLTGDDAWEKQGSCDRYSSTDPGTCPYGNWTMTPGNVVFDHTQGLTVTGSTFQHLGAAGLQLGRNVDDSVLKGNEFTDISGNGVEIGNGADAAPADVTLLPARNTVADNWVHDVASEYTGGVGIFQSYTRDDVIEHNQVNDVPYSGISSNWGWGHTPTKTAGNKILDNLVFDAMQLRSDGGGIYVLGQEGDSLADGLLISGNIVRNDNGADGGHAIYTDGGSTNITMTGNAMFANGTFSMGGCKEDSLPYGGFSFTGNYVENTTPDWPCGTPDNLTLDNTQIAADGTGVPASLVANAGLEPQYAHLAAAPAGPAPRNLALHRPAQAQFVDGSTADLQPGTQPSDATDGDPNTWVQASGQFRWQLVVDLGTVDTLGSATVGMPQPHYATDFHVDASTDGTDWTTAGTVHDANAGTVPVEFSAPLHARYLRIVADKPDDWGQRGDQMAISEVGAYAPASAAANLALDAPTQALFVDGTQADMQPNSLPSYATDGDPATWSQVTGQYRWIQQVDLRAPQPISLVTLLQPDDKFATDFHIDVSTDASTWYTVGRHSGSAGGVTGVQLDKPVTARYLRLIVDRPDQGGQTGGQMGISELGVYSLTAP